MSDTQQEYLQRSVRKLLIDYGLKNVCQTILNTIHEDFLCYSKLLEIKNIEVPTFLKAVVDVKPVEVADVKPVAVVDVKPETVPEVKPEAVVDVKPVVVPEVKSVDVADVKPVAVVDVKPETVPEVKPVENSTECTIGVDASGSVVVVSESTEKNVTVNTAKKPVKKKIIQRPPANEASPENTEGELNDSSQSIDNDNGSEDSKKGDAGKQKQRIKQKQKYEENLSKGIDPKTLLTKENLEQWHGVEGKTFAYIAGELVGCKEEEVSTLIKAFGIQRPNKNMAQNILVGKKTSNK
jgi:hypothetical protein